MDETDRPGLGRRPDVRATAQRAGQIAGWLPGSVQGIAGRVPGSARRIAGRVPGSVQGIAGRVPGSARRIAGRVPGYAVIRHPAVLYTGFAIFAGSVARVGGEAPHRLWGTFAAVAYAGAALAGAWRPARVRQVPLAIALGGAVLAPLGWLAASGAAMPEVGVVERWAAMLLRHGQLYESSAALAAGHQLYGYDPYLPLMMAFGLPHALAGPGLWTDPRLWDGLVFAVLAAAALWVAGATHPGRRTALLVASPLIAFPLAVSGNDLPVVGLILLGLAFAGTPDRAQAASRMTAAAGLALGAAAALKATAWPALVIIGVLVATRDGARTAGRFAVAALAVLAVTAGPVLVTEPVALIQNTIMFPLGLTATVSTAASPLPGHLLAASGAAGHATAVALLVTAAFVLTAVLVRRPPGAAAGRRRAPGAGPGGDVPARPGQPLGVFRIPARHLGLARLEPGTLRGRGR